MISILLAPGGWKKKKKNWCFRFLLQRLAEDSNPAIAAAASKTIYELKKQWEIEEGDSWRFMMNPDSIEEGSQEESNNDTDTKWEVFQCFYCKYPHEGVISHRIPPLITKKVRNGCKRKYCIFCLILLLLILFSRIFPHWGFHFRLSSLILY